MSVTLPYLEPLTPREPGERQIPEPPRRGEPGGPPCRICTGKTTAAVWSDDNWTLHAPVGGSLPGQRGIGVVDLGHPARGGLDGRRVIAGEVRVIRSREPPPRGLDLGRGGAALDAEDRVRIAFHHARQCTGPPS